jgi:hypothetical protein
MGNPVKEHFQVRPIGQMVEWSNGWTAGDGLCRHTVESTTLSDRFVATQFTNRPFDTSSGFLLFHHRRQFRR